MSLGAWMARRRSPGSSDCRPGASRTRGDSLLQCSRNLNSQDGAMTATIQPDAVSFLSAIYELRGSACVIATGIKPELLVCVMVSEVSARC